MLKSPSGPASVFAVYADSNVALASAEHPKNKPSAYKKFRKEWDLIGYAPSLPDDASSSNSEVSSRQSTAERTDIERSSSPKKALPCIIHNYNGRTGRPDPSEGR